MTATPASFLPMVPSVWRRQGYLALVIDADESRVRYLLDGAVGARPPALFLHDFSAAPDLCPQYLTLNFLGRAVDGVSALSVSLFRRLTTMLATNRDDLLKLSEKAFAREYSRIMSLAKPLTKVTSNPEKRGPMVDAMLTKLKDMGDAAAASAAPTDAIASTAAANPGKKKRSAKAAKEGTTRAPRSTTIDKSPATPNPYGPESIKHRAFDRYKKGGDRSEVKADIEAMGVTPATANTWLYFFSQVIRTGKQTGWTEPRSAPPARKAKAKDGEGASKKATAKKGKDGAKKEGKEPAKKPAAKKEGKKSTKKAAKTA